MELSDFYTVMYKEGQRGTDQYPTLLGKSREQLEYWIAGYQDGLGDGGHERELQDFQTRLALDDEIQNALRSF